MNPNDIINDVLRLLEILISWPVILLVIILLVHRKLPDIISSLAQRVTKAPGGFEFIAELKEDVKTLKTRVTEIEEEIHFIPSPALTVKLQQELKSALSKFRTYVQKLGFKHEENPVGLFVDPEFEGSKYDELRHRIVIGEDLAIDNDVAFREYMNYVLLSKVGDADRSTAYIEIESGLAYYFPCSFNNHALFAPELVKEFGPSYTFADLSNNQKFTKIRSSYKFSSQLQGEIWGAAFWEMRQLLDQVPADKLLFDTWFALRPSDRHISRIDFARRLLISASSNESEEHVRQIQAIFENRGLKF